MQIASSGLFQSAIHTSLNGPELCPPSLDKAFDLEFRTERRISRAIVRNAGFVLSALTQGQAPIVLDLVLGFLPDVVTEHFSLS